MMAIETVMGSLKPQKGVLVYEALEVDGEPEDRHLFSFSF
jgi:hypothetical protein